MKRLFLLRHAQAMPTEIGGRDKDRKLSPQGTADAQALGQIMKKKNHVPDFVLCSAARRTKETLAGLAAAFEQDIKTAYLNEFYDGGREEILGFIRRNDEEAHSVLIVAHNPSIYETAVLLAGDGPDSLMQRLTEGFRPGTMTAFDCPCERWTDFKPGENTLTDLLDPLDYNAPATPTRWT